MRLPSQTGSLMVGALEAYFLPNKSLENLSQWKKCMLLRICRDDEESLDGDTTALNIRRWNDDDIYRIHDQLGEDSHWLEMSYY